MKKLLLVVAVMYASLVAAQDPKSLGHLRATNTEVAIFDTPCVDEAVLRQVPEKHKGDAKYARGTYEGVPFKACWIDFPDIGAVIVQWEDGGFFAVERAAFVDEGT